MAFWCVLGWPVVPFPANKTLNESCLRYVFLEGVRQDMLQGKIGEQKILLLLTWARLDTLPPFRIESKVAQRPPFWQSINRSRLSASEATNKWIPSAWKQAEVAGLLPGITAPTWGALSWLNSIRLMREEKPRNAKREEWKDYYYYVVLINFLSLA